MSQPAKKPRFGELLVGDGVLSQEQLNRALSEQRVSGAMLGEMLLAQGIINPPVLVRTLAKCIGVRGCHLRHGLIDPPLLKLIGDEEAQRLKALPMFKVGNTLTVAMAEPQSLPAIDRLRHLTGCKINAVLALEGNIAEFISKYAGGDIDVDGFLASLSQGDVE